MKNLKTFFESIKHKMAEKQKNAVVATCKIPVGEEVVFVTSSPFFPWLKYHSSTKQTELRGKLFENRLEINEFEKIVERGISAHSDSMFLNRDFLFLNTLDSLDVNFKRVSTPHEEILSSYVFDKQNIFNLEKNLNLKNNVIAVVKTLNEQTHVVNLIRNLPETVFCDEVFELLNTKLAEYCKFLGEEFLKTGILSQEQSLRSAKEKVLVLKETILNNQNLYIIGIKKLNKERFFAENKQFEDFQKQFENEDSCRE